jgi:hypothetical protein
MALVRHVASRADSFSRRVFWRVGSGAATLVALKRPSIAGRLGGVLVALEALEASEVLEGLEVARTVRATRATARGRRPVARRPAFFDSTVMYRRILQGARTRAALERAAHSPAAPDAV